MQNSGKVETRLRLDQFDPANGLDRGKPKTIELGWYLVKIVFFLSPFPWPQKIKYFWLRLFGCKIGINPVIKPRVNIHFPWKLTLGDHCWIGEECFILNFEPVHIGSHCCVSQRTFLCGGNHDFRSPQFEYRNGPITIEDGAWVGAQAFVGPNVVIGTDTVITAGSIVTKSLPANRICHGNPCVPLKARWVDHTDSKARDE